MHTAAPETAHIAAEATAFIARPSERVFAEVVPIELPLIFKGHWPIPAVVSVENQSGPWDRSGQTRTVLLSDHSAAREYLLEVTPSTHFSYRVENFTGVFGSLVSHANGEWWFEQDEAANGTNVRWRYEFVPRSQCGAIALEAINTLFWKRYMAEALQAAKFHIENLPPEASAPHELRAND